LSARGGVGSSG
jgi:polyhydroxyalkanoate synthesis regulator phasin